MSKFLCCMSAAVIVLLSGWFNSAEADLIVSSRYSDAVFDVFAAVGPNGERRREVPDPLETFNSSYDLDYSFTGNAFFDNGEVSGGADATGTYDRLDTLESSSSHLNLEYLSQSSGTAISSGDGQAFSNMRGTMQVRFSIDAPTEYSYSLSIASQEGLASSSILFENLFTDIINTSTPGTTSGSGILDVGDYNVFIDSGGGDQNLNPSFETGIDFSLSVGAAVPEPSGFIILGASLIGICLTRRRNMG